MTARLADYANGASPWAVDAADAVVTLTGDTTIDDFRIARLLAGTVIGVRRVHPDRPSGAAGAVIAVHRSRTPTPGREGHGPPCLATAVVGWGDAGAVRDGPRPAARLGSGIDGI